MESNFSFAFNNANFSDRLLQIKIIGSRNFNRSNIIDLARDRKRKREDLSHGLDLATCDVEPGLSKNQGEVESQLVKELHINSAILAARSRFFFKLFSNGMLESQQRQVSLKIDESEEGAVMELLKFIYTNSLSVRTAPALLDVLIIADKYEVASCMKHCSRRLLYLPMTVNFALSVLDLPRSILAADSVKPLINAARRFLVSHYKDLHKFPEEEVMALPLVGMETILASNDLEVSTEDALYDIVLKWIKAHYSDVQERQEILGSRLAPLIRFAYMTSHKLLEIAASGDLSPTQATEIVLATLVYKTESMHRQRRLIPQQQSLSRYTWSAERAYKYKPIQMVEFDIPRHQCIVYLDLTRREFEGIYPFGRLFSQVFQARGHWFSLCAEFKRNPSNSTHLFGLFLTIQETGPVSVTVDYKVSARVRPTEEFVEIFRGNYKFTEGRNVANLDLLGIPSAVMAINSSYFINDVIHLRAKLSVLPQN